MEKAASFALNPIAINLGRSLSRLRTATCPAIFPAVPAKLNGGDYGYALSKALWAWPYARSRIEEIRSAAAEVQGGELREVPISIRGEG